jgi:hypothetical protein
MQTRRGRRLLQPLTRKSHSKFNLEERLALEQPGRVFIGPGFYLQKYALNTNCALSST